MDACTAKTIRTMLLIAVTLVAVYGLWDLVDAKVCKSDKKCTTKYAMFTGGALFAGLALTTMVIVNSERMGYDASLAENISGA